MTARVPYFIYSLLLIVSTAAGVASAPQPDHGAKTLFLTLRMNGSGVELVSSHLVPAAIRNPDVPADGAIRYSVKSADGSVLFTGHAEDPLRLNYDYAGEDGRLQGGAMQLPEAVFVVRLPYLRGTRTVAFHRRAGGLAKGESLIGSIDCAAALAKQEQATPIALPAASTMQLIYGDSTKKRVNYVVLSEGYTQTELNSGKFVSDLKIGVDHHFTCTPFKEYKNFYNVWAISVPSNTSGLGGYFGSQQNGRLIYLSGTGTTNVSNTLRQLRPDYDLVLVLVNTTIYGGAGSTFAVATVNSQCGELIAHETGHGYVRLGDEYDYAGASASECPNATRETVRDRIKWTAWILGATPVPTPETSAYNTVIGLFEGAQYNTTGWYRPKFNCKMNNLNVPFCEVCIEAVIARQYKSMSPIDTFRPAVLSQNFGSMTDKRLLVETVQPQGRTVKTDWFVNGTPVLADRDTLNLATVSLISGQNRVQAIVTDKTPMVKIPLNLPALKDTVTWTVTSSGTGSSVPLPGPNTLQCLRISGKTKISFDSRSEKFLNVSMLDLSGKAVCRHRINVPLQGSNLVIAPAIPAGVYLVQVRSAAGGFLYSSFVTIAN